VTDAAELSFEDHFDGPDLDPAVWLPCYLPAWSSRAATAADVELRDSCLHLRLRPGRGHWLPEEHRPPLRVSGIQSGNGSGPVGGTLGQQPWRPGAVVREEQPRFAGYTPTFGRLEMRARFVLGPRSMAAWWMVGLQDVMARSAEICVAEIFGDAVDPGRSAAVGMGLHPFDDPDGREDFAAVRMPIDVAEFHSYVVDWTADAVEFAIDGIPVRRCPGPPRYPMQMMLAVFDFPERAVPTGRPTGTPGTDEDTVPELVVDVLRAWPAGSDHHE
jgi:hypothetical protein